MEDLYCFCTIVEQGSIQKAAESLEVPAPTLSRRLKQLEAKIGFKLLNRSAHHLVLTTDGELFYSRLSAHFSEIDLALSSLNEDESELQGEIVMSLPVGMLRICVNEWIVEFLKKWPKVSIKFSQTRSIKDFERNKVDIALKLEPNGPNDWIVKKILSNRKCLVASPDYLKNMSVPKSHKDLIDHNIIVNEDYAEWKLATKEGIVSIRQKPRYQLANIFDTLDAVLLGLGIGYFPEFLVSNYLQQNKLELVLPSLSMEESSIYLLYSDRALLSHRVKVFLEFLQQKASDENLEKLFAAPR